MRYTLALVAAFSFVALSFQPSHAATVQEMADKMKNPILVKATDRPRLSAIFNHNTHSNVPCQTCHHKEGDLKTQFAPCDSCHKREGYDKTNPMRAFNAFHSRTSEHSCYGCHSALRRENPSDYPTFKNCRPCHQNPKATIDSVDAPKAAADKK